MPRIYLVMPNFLFLLLSHCIFFRLSCSNPLLIELLPWFLQKFVSIDNKQPSLLNLQSEAHYSCDSQTLHNKYFLSIVGFIIVANSVRTLFVLPIVSQLIPLPLQITKIGQQCITLGRNHLATSPRNSPVPARNESSRKLRLPPSSWSVWRFPPELESLSRRQLLAWQP